MGSHLSAKMKDAEKWTFFNLPERADDQLRRDFFQLYHWSKKATLEACFLTSFENQVCNG